MDALDDTAARISALEFAIEIIWANQLAWADVEASARVKEQFVEMFATAYGPLTSDPGMARRMLDMKERAQEHAANLAMKVWRRECLVREGTAQEPSRRPRIE